MGTEVVGWLPPGFPVERHMMFLGSLGLLAVVFIFFGFFSVRQDRAVIMLRWGKFNRILTKPGLYFGFPVGRELLSVSTQRLTYAAEEVVVNPDGDQVRARGRLSYRVVDPRMAATEVSDLKEFVEHQVAVVLRLIAVSQDAVGSASALQNRLSLAGLTVLEFTADFEVVLHEEVLRPSSARAWARSVVAAHAVLQDAAIQGIKKVQETAEEFPKSVRGDVLALAVIPMDSVASNLPKAHNSVD